MLFNHEKKGDVLLIHLSGRIDSAVAKEFEEEVFKVLEAEKAAKVLIDCQNLNYISSAGLRVLLMGAKQIKQGFWLCGLQPHILEIFKVSGFSSILNIASSQEEALSKL